MLIASRNLILEEGGREVVIAVRLFQPAEKELGWTCLYEITWPQGTMRSEAYGYDSIQALLLALNKIAADLHASEHHRRGRLRWQKSGDGYGFPISHNLRDLLTGDDQRL